MITKLYSWATEIAGPVWAGSKQITSIDNELQSVLTIRLGVAVCQGRDAHQDLPMVPLHHQLQFSPRLLDQLPRITQRQILCYCPVNLFHNKQTI